MHPEPSQESDKRGFGRLAAAILREQPSEEIIRPKETGQSVARSIICRLIFLMLKTRQHDRDFYTITMVTKTWVHFFLLVLRFSHTRPQIRKPTSYHEHFSLLLAVLKFARFQNKNERKKRFVTINYESSIVKISPGSNVQILSVQRYNYFFQYTHQQPTVFNFFMNTGHLHPKKNSRPLSETAVVVSVVSVVRAPLLNSHATDAITVGLRCDEDILALAHCALNSSAGVARTGRSSRPETSHGHQAFEGVGG